MTITARLSIRRPDGSREEHRLEFPGEDAWVGLLERLEGRFGPGEGRRGSVDSTVAAILANLPKPSQAPDGLRGSGVRDSSLSAYDDLRTSGRLTRQQRQLIEFMSQNFKLDYTRQELAKALGWGINIVTGRANELLTEPFAYLSEFPRRQCRVTGQLAHPLRLSSRNVASNALK